MHPAGDWYISRDGGVYGPYSWSELLEHARSGHVGPTDTVQGPGTGGWVRASDLPGLFGAASAPGSASRRRAPLMVGLAFGVLVLVGACCLGSLSFLRSTRTADIVYEAPGSDSLIETDQWGVVPANQVVVMLQPEASDATANKAAKAINGRITGKLPFIGVHIITTDGTGEGDLREAIRSAAGVDGVEAAFPNEPIYLDTTFRGVPCTPLDDRVYADGRDRPQQMTGTPRAWDILRAAGIPLSSVHVGVSDDGLFRNAEAKGSVNFVTEEADDELGQALKEKDGTDKKYYSHGTMVSGIIGADPDNGGMAGIAGPLGKNLKISMKNIFSGKYGVNTTATPDAADPTKIDYSDGTFAMGDLLALKKLVDDGAQVVNCSWGNTNATKYTAKAYKRFFEYMNEKHPDVLFVCSAGNDGIAVDGETRIPSGLSLPNMVTVGCLENDGDRVNYSNRASSNYEVTLAAPGHRIVGGVSPDGEIRNINGGTSSAAPQVTSAAALLLAANPKLKAADIKRILTETARGKIISEDGKTTKAVPSSVGGRCLAIDEALLRVVNDVRKDKGLPALTDKTIQEFSRVVLTATSGPDDQYDVKATIPQAGDSGTEVELSYSGPASIGGLTRQRVSSGGSAKWTASLLDDALTIHAKRIDNGACARVTIKSIAGTYKGYYDTAGRTGSGRMGSYRVPMTVVVKPDGTFSGKFSVSTSLPSIGLSRLKESGSFSGRVSAAGNVICSGTARISVTFAESGYSTSNTGAFSLKGKISGDRLIGTMKGVGGSVPFALTRQ